MFAGRFDCGRIIPGHEFIGRVVSVGKDFLDAEGNQLFEGERVAVESTIPCGVCVYCQGNGSRYDKTIDYAACEKYTLVGRITLGDPILLVGGYSQFSQLPHNTRVHKMDNDIPLEEVVLMEPLAVAVRAVHKAGITPGDTVVIQGPGPIGLLCLVAAQMAGATKVLLTGAKNDVKRLELGRLLGAMHIINSTEDDPIKILNELTGGRKADRVLDATGSAIAFGQGVMMTARGGVYTNLGGFSSDTAVSIYPDYLKRNKIDIRFSHTGANHYQKAREIIASRRFPLGKIISHKVPLEGVEQALHELSKHTGDHIKVAISMES